MDTDKDNKQPLDVPKDNDPKTEDNDDKNDNKNDDKNDDQHLEKPGVEDQLPRDEGHDQVDDGSPKPASDKTADQPDSEIKADAEIKEDQEEKDPADNETKLEEDQSPPPPPLDLQKISEEIDQYILTLSTTNHSSTPPQDDESNTISTPPQDDVDDKSGTIRTPPQDDGDDKSGTITTPPQDNVDDKSGTLTTPPQDDADDKSGTITTQPQDDVDDKSGTITTPPQEHGDDKSGTITTPPQDDLDDKSGTISTPPQDAVDDESGTLTTPPQDEEDVDVLPSFVEQFVFMVEAKIADHDSMGSPVKWSTLNEEDSDTFVEAIIRLSSLSKSLPREPKYARSQNRIGAVLQRAMSYIEEEFKSLVEDYKINDSDSNPSPHANANANASASETPTKTNQETSDDHPNPPESPAPAAEVDIYFPGYPNEILSSLIKLSKTMMVVGHETECCQVYFVARRNALEHSLHKLGFEKHSIDEVQKMQWESLEREIISWIGAFKQCATSHLSCERHLSQSVFPGHPAVSDSIFCSLSQCMILQLLNFAGAVALTKRAIDKVFKFLDVYESLKETIPKINELFPEEWMSDVTTEASMIRGRIGETIVAIFVELENSIQTDATKAPVPGGAVHPLVRYTMNYLKTVCDGYKATLEQIFREHQKIERADSATGSDFNYNNHQQSGGGGAAAVQNQSPFQVQMTKVMDSMDAYLETRSKLYKDHALSSIFMMNNGRYILQKIKASSEINALMGDSWCRKRSTELRQYHKGYQRETWGKLLSSLHPEGLMSNGKIVKPVVKERFKSFNTMFDEIHKTQSTWVVSDEQLQSELRVSISNMVIPAYRSFLGRYGQVFTPGRQTEKYVKYQAEDIETYIDELFDGNAAPQAGRKRQ